MNRSRTLPTGLARRFAFAAAGLAAAALLLTSLASWWLIDQQRRVALSELSAHERTFRALAVSGDLEALASRMAEIAGSSILATGLVDSAGRETYLAPFLGGIRQINGVPVQVMFTDFQGIEIASNTGARFTPEQTAWFRQQLDAGKGAARIFSSELGHELVGFEPMVYARTASPEGAVLYKIRIVDLNVPAPMTLEWGQGADPAPAAIASSTAVPTPEVFQHLDFRVSGEDWAAAGAARLDVPYVHILLISLALFGVVALAGIKVARMLTVDLQRLESFSRRLVGSGLSSERAPEAGTDEVSSLARSINDMLDRLNQQHLALLSEREKLTELTRALQAADRRKDDFLAMLGHELRNPLAPISAGAELLSRLPVSDPRVLRTSELITRQVGHMTKIVSDLLDVSRVTRGLIALEKQPVDVAEIVAAGVEQVRPLIEQRRHRLSIATDVSGQGVYVLADRARMIQVLSNLLTNAAKYTPEGGRIEVRLSSDADEVRIDVEDNGNGIPPELVGEVFDLFTQGSRAADRTQGGLGLGLALVKHLVELHGGTVRVESEGSGKGARFQVRLPRVAAPDTASARPAAAPHVPAGGLRVVVVDDNVDAAETLAQLVELEGHRVTTHHDGPSTLAWADKGGDADAFILDIGLPGMDGTELARRLRAVPRLRRALLVALTGYGQAADREKSAAAGFDHHLVKPVDPEMLRALLASAAGAQRALPMGDRD